MTPEEARRGTCQCCGRSIHKSALVCTACALSDPEAKAWLAIERDSLSNNERTR